MSAAARPARGAFATDSSAPAARLRTWPCAAPGAAGVGCGEGSPLPAEKGEANRVAIWVANPWRKCPARLRISRSGMSAAARPARGASATDPSAPAPRLRTWPSAAPGAAGVGCGEGSPLPAEKGEANRVAIWVANPWRKCPARLRISRSGMSAAARPARGASATGSSAPAARLRTWPCAAPGAAGVGCGEGSPLPAEKGEANRVAIWVANPWRKCPARLRISRSGMSAAARPARGASATDPSAPAPRLRTWPCAAPGAAGVGCGEGSPLPAEKGEANRVAIWVANPWRKCPARLRINRSGMSAAARPARGASATGCQKLR